MSAMIVMIILKMMMIRGMGKIIVMMTMIMMIMLPIKS